MKRLFPQLLGLFDPHAIYAIGENGALFIWVLPFNSFPLHIYTNNARNYLCLLEFFFNCNALAH